MDAYQIREDFLTILITHARYKNIILNLFLSRAHNQVCQVSDGSFLCAVLRINWWIASLRSCSSFA